jgi:hypothetical protein
MKPFPEDPSLIFLGFVVPLAIYGLLLAAVHRSQHPTLVAGTWDFAGVLFAASGFLVLGGPAILTGLYEQWRLSWLLGQTRFLGGFSADWHFWVGVWALYFLVIAVGSGYFLWRRRLYTSIYNIDPALCEELLTQVLDRLSLEWRRGPAGQLLIRPPQKDFIPWNGLARAEWLTLEIEPFAALRHAALCWPPNAEPVRREVEPELARTLAEVQSGESPLAGWFLSFSLTLFLLTVLGLFTIMVMRAYHLPR